MTLNPEEPQISNEYCAEVRGLGARIACQTEASDAMGRWRVGKQRRREMVDAAIKSIEKVDLQLVSDRPTESDRQWLRKHRETTARFFAIEAANTKATGVMGWWALQIFIRVALPIILRWWDRRRETI